MAKALAARLGFDHVSAGDFMREMATERGLSILELSKIAEQDDTIDREIDERTVRFAATRDDFVMDARLAWHFIPDSVKVFLEVRPDVAADRIYGHGRSGESENVDQGATRRAIEARIASERQRYRDYYGVDYLDPTPFDIIVDTSDIEVVEVVAEIVTELGSQWRADSVGPDDGRGPL